VKEYNSILVLALWCHITQSLPSLFLTKSRGDGQKLMILKMIRSKQVSMSTSLQIDVENINWKSIHHQGHDAHAAAFSLQDAKKFSNRLIQNQRTNEKCPDAGIMKEAEKTFSKLKCSNNQTENALPSSAVNVFTTRREIHPRKTIKNKYIYQSHSFRSKNRCSS
jgi:hypothetical protein